MLNTSPFVILPIGFGDFQNNASYFALQNNASHPLTEKIHFTVAQPSLELVQDFRTMVNLRQLAFLPRWIEEAKASGMPELRRFAEGLYRDYDVMRAALSFEYSNRQTEGRCID